MRSTALLLAAGVLLVMASARAEEWEPMPPPAADPHLLAPPAADASPTNRACDVEALIAGRTCLLEGATAAPGRGPSVAEVAQRACAQAARPPGAARPEAAVAALCAREFQGAALSCAEPGAALADTEGRFLPAARACYARFADLLAQARFRAAAGSACCACLVEQRCAKADACHQELPDPAPATRGCMARACSAACGAWMPPPAPAPAPAEDTVPASEAAAVQPLPL